MLFTEWDWEKALEVRYREGMEKGMEMGIEMRMEKELIDLLKSGKSPEEIIEFYEKMGSE
jgi:hypothetical protein